MLYGGYLKGLSPGTMLYMYAGYLKDQHFCQNAYCCSKDNGPPLLLLSTIYTPPPPKELYFLQVSTMMP